MYLPSVMMNMYLNELAVGGNNTNTRINVAVGLMRPSYPFSSGQFILIRSIHSHQVNSFSSGQFILIRSIHPHQVNSFSSGQFILIRSIHSHQVNSFSSGQFILIRSIHGYDIDTCIMKRKSHYIVLSGTTDLN